MFRSALCCGLFPSKISSSGERFVKNNAWSRALNSALHVSRRRRICSSKVVTVRFGVVGWCTAVYTFKDSKGSYDMLYSFSTVLDALNVCDSKRYNKSADMVVQHWEQTAAHTEER